MRKHAYWQEAEAYIKEQGYALLQIQFPKFALTYPSKDIVGMKSCRDAACSEAQL